MTVVAVTPHPADLVLADLGDTCADVARSLAERGITGRPGSLTGCPIAVLLRDALSAVAVSVIDDHALVAYPGRAPDEWIDIPETVRQFIARFDRGEYAELAVA